MATIKKERLKICHICKNYLKLDHFYKNKNKKDGLHNICKSCMREKRKNSKFNEYISNSRSNRLISGLCLHCTNHRLKHHSMYCEKHWFKNISSNNLKSVRFWRKLTELWHNQDKRCVYTKELLIPGFNMSLDHKDPKSRFKDERYNIENLQWVTIRINISKHALTHKEFIEMCGIVYNTHLQNLNDANSVVEMTIEH